MFEQYTDQLWAALFAAVIFYGLWQWLRAPFLVKKFYKQYEFVDEGASVLSESRFGKSQVLKRLSASNIYTGVYKNHQISQFAAFPADRHKFTMSKAKRKQNQSVWTVTVLNSESPLVQFCARPTIVSTAIEYVLDRNCVEFPADEKFSNKVHILADDHDQVRSAFTLPVREYLTELDPLSLESVDGMLILMGPRQPHEVGKKFQAEIDSLIRMYKEISSANEAAEPVVNA